MSKKFFFLYKSVKHFSRGSMVMVLVVLSSRLVDQYWLIKTSREYGVKIIVSMLYSSIYNFLYI